MNKHLRIFLCSVISVLMIFALAIAGCTTTTTTSTSSDSSTTVSDSTGTESTGSDSTGSGDSTTGDSSGSGDSSETHVHDYDYANYELVLSDDMSEATVIVPCTGCDESLTVTASITSEVKTAATNLAKGVTTYTASFTLDGVDYTIPVDVDTPALATVYDAYYINNVESSLADIELFDGFATATGGYWYNNANVTMDDCAIADGYVFQGRLYLSNGKSLTFTLEEDATVTIYALLSYNGNTVIVDEAETEVYSFVSTTTDYNDVKALEMDLDAGTYTISNEKGNTTIYAFMLQDSGKTSVYTEGLWQPAAEEEPDEPVTPDEPIDEDVSSVPETLTLGDNEVTISSTDSNGDGVSSTFTAEEDGTYTFAISADEDGYVMINNSYRLSASGTTSCNIELSAEQSVTVTFWTDDYATATYTLNISSAAVASGTFELETETDYTFTAPIAGTYTFTLSDGDTSTAVIYAGKASYDAYGSALLDVQEDGTSFTYDLAEGETLTLYLAGSDGVTVSYTTGSATSGGDEGGSGTVTETVIPTLAAGDNAISVTASDAATLGGTSSDGYVKYYGASATYTAPENGYYTFSIGASDEYAYVFVVYPDGYYKLSSNSTTTADVYANGIYLTGGTTVTVYFSTDNGSGNFIAASYTFTISYEAGTSSLVIPSELTIGGTADVVMDQDTRLDVSATTVESGTYTIYLSYYDDLSAVSITYIIDGTYYYPVASNDYTITIDLMAGKEINVYAYFTTDSSATAAFGITITYVAKEVETYELTINAYVLGSSASALTAYDDSATDVAIKEGKSIYLKAAPANATADYNFTLTISSLDNLTIYASDDINSSDTTMAADGSYDMEILASYFTKNEDGTYSYSWTLQRRTYAFFKITATADVTIDVSIVYGGEGGTLGGGSTGGEDTNTYVALPANETTTITWTEVASSSYAVYYTYTANAAAEATLTLSGTHGFFSSSMVSALSFTVTLNGETVTGSSNILYTLNLVAGENKIIITFAAASSLVTGYEYYALLTVEETEVDPTEGYTALTANKTTEITWDGESSAYTVSYYYSASEATTATLTLTGTHAWADSSNNMFSQFITMFTVTLNGETVTSSSLVYTLNLTEGYNYIVISFTGSSNFVSGYTYTVKLACEDASHVHTYTDATWVWSDDYSSATLTLACTGCDETISYKVDSTSQVTQEATCTTYGEKVYTVTYTYGDNTYTDTKTVSTPYAHSLTHYDAVAATLTTDGNIEYWYCSECGKYFSDAEGDTEVEYSELVLTYNTSSTLYNMSATGLTTSTYLYADDTIFDDEFSVASTSTSTSSTFSIKYASISDYVVADGVDTTYKGTTVDFSGAVYNFTATRGLSFTITQSAKVTIWYGLGHRNSSYNLYITTGYGSASAVTSGAVASFAYDTNVADYVNNYYKYVLEGSATLSAGTYYLTTNATSSSTAATYIYAIAIDYDLSGVTISGETEVTAGNSITLTAAATLADGSASSDAIVWTTSDSSIATVDNGVVTGVAAGTVTITATAGNVSASCTITVTAPVTVTAVTVTGDTTATVGDTLNLTYTVTMSDGSAFTGTVTWATSDSSIATVANGVVTAIAAGEVTITATADGVYGTITITVEKAPAAAMVAGETYSVDLTTTDTYVETSITITEAGYYTVTVSANGIISISDSSSTYYYNNMNCYLGYIIDYAAADEVAIKVEAGTILSVYISLYDPDTAGTVTATIALDANYNEGGSGDSGDSGEVTASGSFELATETDYTFTATEAGTYTFTISGDADYACVYAGYASYENWESALLDVQSDYSYSFTYDLAAGETLTLYLTGSNGATVTWSVVGSAAATTTVYNMSDYTIDSSVTEDTEIEDDDLVTITVESGCAYVEATNTNTDLEVDDGVDLTGYVGVGSSTGVVITLKSDATVTIYYSTRKTTWEIGVYNSSDVLVGSYGTTSANFTYVLKATIELTAGTYTIKGVDSASEAIWSIIVAPSTSSDEAATSGTFELETETDYTFTATEAGTYTFTLSGDADYACVYAGYASYENWDSALLDVQGDYSYSFTYDLAAGETLTLYLTGSDGATVTWSVGTSSGDDEGGETDVSVVPTLEIGDNTIYITAADSNADGVTVAFTATGEGDYTFSATGDAWVEVGAYKATVSGSVSQTLTLTEGEVVTITFYTYSYDAATYTFTIAYTAAETASYTAMSFAGEDDVTSGWAYWNDQWWCGSGVTVSEAKYAENDDGTYTVVFAISSDENSNCTFGFQLFYNDTTNYTVGSTYTLTATITSDIDVTVKFNDKEYTLTAGNAQDISVEFIYKGDAGISLFDFQYAISGAITANVTISNIKWTAATSGDDSGDSGDEGGETSGTVVSLAFVESYGDHYFHFTATSTLDISNGSYDYVTVNGEQLWSEGTLNGDGTYTFKVYVGDLTLSEYVFNWYLSGEIIATATYVPETSSGDDSGSTEATTVEYSYNFSNIFTSDDVSSLSGSFTGSSDTETTYYFTESSYTTTAAEGTDYVLTYTTAKTNDKIASTSITDEDGTTYSYAVQPNGSTTGSNLRYFTIDLSEYAGTGKTVTIEIIGTSKTGAQIVLASGATDTSTTNAYAYNTAAESDYATVDVVSYTGTVSSTGLYYITFASQSSRIYAINITVSDATAAE